MTWSTSTRRSPFRAFLNPLIITLSVLLLIGASAVAGFASETPNTAGVSEVGRLDRVPADALKLFGNKIVPAGYHEPFGSPAKNASFDSGVVGTLLFLPEARQLWQLFPYLDGGFRTAVAVRDPDSLAIRDSFVLNLNLRRGGLGASGGDWMHATDGTSRVFLVTSGGGSVVAIDLRTFKVREYPLPTMGLSPIGGITYDPHANRVILAMTVFGSASVLNAYTNLYQLDLASGAVTGPRPMRSCNAPLPSAENNRTYQVAPYVANERHVFVPCQRSGYSGAVVRIPRNAVMDPASPEDIVVGPTNLETVLVDSGSGRLFLVTVKGEMWAFDTETMAFVGLVGANADNSKSTELGYGIDPVTGRVFFLSPSFGLGSAEGRFFPIPQANTYPGLAKPGQERLVSDAVSGNLFVLSGAAVNKALSYAIYRLPPAPVPPPPPDPDRNTTDRPEVEGETDARYFANASGYGTRVLLANGWATIVPAPGVGDLTPTADVLANRLSSRCGFTDREMVAGRVSKTEADTGSTAAQAIAVDVDPRTRLDLDRPSRCDFTGRDANGTEVFKGIFSVAPAVLDNTSGDPRWNHDPASCSSSEGGDPTSGNGDDHNGPVLGPSEVECPLPGGKVTARAEAELTGPMKVAQSWTKTSITRDSKGVHSTSEALAGNVDIAGIVRIAEVRSLAVSSANGRPGTGELSKHTVTIKGLRVNGTEVCGVCEPREAVDTLNRVLAGKVQFRLGAGAADARLVKGSSRGALTAIQKSPERQVSDQSLVGDFTTEIPALEMVVFNDNNTWGRARQLYQFAGVATSATYNVVVIPKGTGLTDEFAPDGPTEFDPEAVIDGFGGVPGSEGGPVVESPTDTGDDGFFAPLGRALRAVARGIRLFVTSPRHALLLLTGWGLFVLPAVAFKRRLLLHGLD